MASSNELMHRIQQAAGMSHSPILPIQHPNPHTELAEADSDTRHSLRHSKRLSGASKLFAALDGKQEVEDAARLKQVMLSIGCIQW